MPMTDHLVSALKQRMKGKGLTYKDAAAALKLSEVSVKRLFSEKHFTLQRVETLCDMADISFGELLDSAEAQIRKTEQLTLEQEQAIVANPRLLLVGVCIINRLSFADILARYRFGEPELIGLFTALDRLGIIELLPGNRYRLKIAPDFRWQPNGPIQRFFLESIVNEYLREEAHDTGNHMHMVWGMLSKASSQELVHKIRRLIDDYVKMSAQSARLPTSEKLTSSLLLLFKEDWEPSVFKMHGHSQSGIG